MNYGDYMNYDELERLEQQGFDLSEYNSDDIKKSGFYIVAKSWSINNPNASSLDKQKFIKQFFIGFSNRASQKIDTKDTNYASSSTFVVDPLVSSLASSLVSASNNNEYTYTEEDIAKVYRESLVCKNIIDSFLREYIANNVIDKGWACCWDNTAKNINTKSYEDTTGNITEYSMDIDATMDIDKVNTKLLEYPLEFSDFVSVDGYKLLITNEINSRNIKSNALNKKLVESNIENIKLWHRYDPKNGKTYWDKLNKIIGQGSNMSEEDFNSFIMNSYGNKKTL